MASVGPAPSLPRHSNNGAQEEDFSEAEQDCKISSSNSTSAPNPVLTSTRTSVAVSSESGGNNGRTSESGSGHLFSSSSGRAGNARGPEGNGVSVSGSVDSGGGNSIGSGRNGAEPVVSVMFNPSDQGSRTSTSYNSPDSSISSSTNNYSVGGGGGGVESDLEAIGESSAYRAPCVTEDDAGSSSHSEVRSSSPGLADADADVKDSPSGSEETGSESERGGNSAPNMYAPNTVGFPPSRSSLTHCSPTPGSFGSTVKFAPGSNPFAVKGLPPGSISSSNSPGPITSSDRVPGNQNSNNSFSPSSRINAGRWGSSQPQPLKPASMNTRPIIRPSALATSKMIYPL